MSINSPLKGPSRGLIQQQLTVHQERERGTPSTLDSYLFLCVLPFLGSGQLYGLQQHESGLGLEANRAAGGSHALPMLFRTSAHPGLPPTALLAKYHPWASASAPQGWLQSGAQVPLVRICPSARTQRMCKQIKFREAQFQYLGS